jgi:hypothetical protein
MWWSVSTPICFPHPGQVGEVLLAVTSAIVKEACEVLMVTPVAADYITRVPKAAHRSITYTTRYTELSPAAYCVRVRANVQA